MLLSLLSKSAFSYDDKCVAPHTMPPPVENMKLKFVQVLTRHGARAPLGSYQVPMQFRGYWQCDSDDAIAPRMHAAPVEHYRRFKQVLDQRLTEYLPNCRSGDLLVKLLINVENYRHISFLMLLYFVVCVKIENSLFLLRIIFDFSMKTFFYP